MNLSTYDARKQWTKEILTMEIAYPAEYVIRIFKGKYPRLNLRENSYVDKKICDVGCGDGRNFVVLKECGLNLYGTEITPEIVEKVNRNLQKAGLSGADIRVGNNEHIPFDDNYFDYLLSWNACYYMGGKKHFEEYVDEFARVLKKGGYLILSIPKKTCFIFHDSEKLDDGYCIIRKDPFNIRNGEIMRIFENEQEIEKTFSRHFENFIFGSDQDDCFGFDYHWHLVVCQKG